MLALRVHKRKVMMVNGDKWLFDFELLNVSCFAGLSGNNHGIHRGQGAQERNSHLYVLAKKEDGTGSRVFSVDTPPMVGNVFVGGWVNLGIGWVSESATRTEFDLWDAGRQEHIGSGNIRLDTGVCRHLADHGTSLVRRGGGGPVNPTPNERTVTVLLQNLSKRLSKAQREANNLTRALVKIEERRFPMFQFVGNERGMVSAIAFLQGYRNLSRDVTQQQGPGKVGFVGLMSELQSRCHRQMFLQPIFEYIAGFDEDSTIHGLGSPDWVAAMAIHGPWFNPQDSYGANAVDPQLIREANGYEKGGHYLGPSQYTLPDIVPQSVRQNLRESLKALRSRQAHLQRLSQLHQHCIYSVMFGNFVGSAATSYQQQLDTLSKPEFNPNGLISNLVYSLNQTRSILTQTHGES